MPHWWNRNEVGVMPRTWEFKKPGTLLQCEFGVDEAGIRTMYAKGAFSDYRQYLRVTALRHAPGTIRHHAEVFWSDVLLTKSSEMRAWGVSHTFRIHDSDVNPLSDVAFMALLGSDDLILQIDPM